MLNRVVFPEPFGPISPAMLPCSISIEQSLSACTPPKAFETPSVRSSAMLTPPAAPFPVVRVRPLGQLLVHTSFWAMMLVEGVPALDRTWTKLPTGCHWKTKLTALVFWPLG